MGNNYSDDYVPKEDLGIISRQYKPNELNNLNEKLNIIEKARSMNLNYFK